MESLLLYYITDRRQFPGNESQRLGLLLHKIAEAARCRVDYIQLREKDLRTGELEALARQAIHSVSLGTANRQFEAGPASAETRPRLLINSRTDVALATGADGVHLPSNDISPLEIRKVWQRCSASELLHESRRAKPVVAVSCHNADEVAAASENGADFAVFGPVFEKRGKREVIPVGLEALRQACRYKIPVLALGGVTLENASQCVEAGAAGIAAIRLFQENAIDAVVRTIRPK